MRLRSWERMQNPGVALIRLAKNAIFSALNEIEPGGWGGGSLDVSGRFRRPDHHGKPNQDNPEEGCKKTDQFDQKYSPLKGIEQQ